MAAAPADADRVDVPPETLADSAGDTDDETTTAEPEPDAPARSTGMSYHAAHTKRGVLMVGQAVAAVGAVFVGIVAIQGELVSYAGIAAALVTLAAVLVVLRTGAMTSRVSLDQGLLEVVHGDNRHRFDLTVDSTQLELSGEPGDPDWKMLVSRRGLSPVTVTSRVVDPEPFTEAVLSWRPDAG